MNCPRPRMSRGKGGIGSGIFTQADRGRGRFTNRPYGNKAVRIARYARNGEGVYTFWTCRRLRHDKVCALRTRVSRGGSRSWAVHEPPLREQHDAVRQHDV